MNQSLITIANLVASRDLELLSKFGNRKGADEPYLEWLKLQPCCRCGQLPHWQMDTLVLNVPCHLREVARGAGTAIKPQWNAFTMCNACHKLEHQHGRSRIGCIEDLQRMAYQSLLTFVLSSLRGDLGPSWLELLPGWISSNTTQQEEKDGSDHNGPGSQVDATGGAAVAPELAEKKIGDSGQR